MTLADLLFPPRCAACERPGGWPMCWECTSRVAVLTPPWCARCGRPTASARARCADCPPAPVRRARSPFLYDGPLASAIKGMKFAGWHALASNLSGAMAEVGIDLGGDVVTWVPLSRRRRRRRGFDQAEELARGVARRLELPVTRLLVRSRDTAQQARSTGPERRRALRGAFRPCARPPARVLLVDDVLTTGATAAACAHALLGAGATEVDVLTAARSLGSALPARCRGLEPRGGTRVP